MSRGTRDTPRAHQDFAYGAFTLFGRPFQTVLLSLKVPHRSPTTPEGISSRRFGLFPFRSPLLRESQLIYFPPGTEMFQFPGFASRHLCIRCGIPHEAVGFPIRRSADQSLFAAPRGLSQRTTSFIASCRRGIHQMPLRRLIVPIIDAHPSCDAPRQKRRRMAPMERSCLRGMTSNDDLGLLKKSPGPARPVAVSMRSLHSRCQRTRAKANSLSDNALAR